MGINCASKLGLQVWNVLSNPTAQQMQDEVKRFAEIDHACSFMGAVMLCCRGTTTMFQGSSGTEIEKARLFRYFDGVSLRGKPKLWFVQPCQSAAYARSD